MALSALRIVMMGVSGAGKTTVGRALADHIGVDFVDADDLHSADAKAKMAAGEPLDDDDRAPWIERVAARLRAGDRGVVVACSALAYRYREHLGKDETIFVHLTGSRNVIARRLALRNHEYMPPSLLDSQFTALENLLPEENGFAVDIDAPLADIVETIVWTLHNRSNRSG